MIFKDQLLIKLGHLIHVRSIIVNDQFDWKFFAVFFYIDTAVCIDFIDPHSVAGAESGLVEHGENACL